MQSKRIYNIQKAQSIVTVAVSKLIIHSWKEIISDKMEKRIIGRRKIFFMEGIWVSRSFKFGEDDFRL